MSWRGRGMWIEKGRTWTKKPVGKTQKEEGTEELKRDFWDECGHEKYQANAGEASLVTSLRTSALLLSLLALLFFSEMLTSFRVVPPTINSAFSALSIFHALVSSE